MKLLASISLLALPFLLGCVLTVSGCAGGQADPVEVDYAPYSQQQCTPKTAESPLVCHPLEISRRQFTKIGRLSMTTNVTGGTKVTWEGFVQRFREEALARGADGIVGMMVNNTPYQYQYYVPGHTTYDPVTTYQSGTFYGSTPGYYSGTSTSSVPVYHPGYSMQRYGILSSIFADLIVFLDKDTYGQIGVQIDQQAQNIDGLRIAMVLDGWPAAEAGLTAGDIVVAIDGEPVRNYGALLDRTSKIGVPVQVEFLRQGQKRQVTVTPKKGYYGESLSPEKADKP